MGVMDTITGAVGAGTGLLSSIYNIWNNESQKAYERDLQQKQWEREDTAVQRRMADLKQAGLNPILATGGTGASSSTVSQSGRQVDMSPLLKAIQFQEYEKNALANQNVRLQNKQQDIINTSLAGSDDYIVGKIMNGTWTAEEVAKKLGLKTVKGLSDILFGSLGAAASGGKGMIYQYINNRNKRPLGF